MIREVARELQVRLQANGDPLAVVLGPEPLATATWGRERIVLEYDTEAADSFGDPRGHHTNPKHRYTAVEACKLTIYARSAIGGAAVFEHRRRCKKIRDDVVVSLEYVARARRNRFKPGAGKFFTPPALQGTETAGGAAYELKFLYARPVEVRTFVGAAQPEATLGLRMTGTPALTFAAADSSITRDAGSWVDEGFAIGMHVAIAGSVSNDVMGEIATVTHTVLTLSATPLMDEGPVTGCTVRAGGFTNCTLVSRANGPDDDNNPNTPPATSEAACGDC